MTGATDVGRLLEHYGMTLDQVRRIAEDVASTRDPKLQILSVSTAEGGSAYTEVMVVVGSDEKFAWP